MFAIRKSPTPNRLQIATTAKHLSTYHAHASSQALHGHQQREIEKSAQVTPTNKYHVAAIVTKTPTQSAAPQLPHHIPAAIQQNTGSLYYFSSDILLAY